MKKRLAAAICILTLAACTAVAEDVAQARQKADHAGDSECAKICIDAAHALVEQANREFKAGTVEQAQKSMKDAVEYAHKAATASIKSHKNEKHLEIELRKLGNRMESIGDSLEVDDRLPVREGQKMVDQYRDDVLDSLFDHPRKTFEEKKK